MLFKFQYSNTEERENIISQNKEKILLEEQNVKEGDFLIFSDIKPIENQLQDIKNNTDMIILKQEGII